VIPGFIHWADFRGGDLGLADRKQSGLLSNECRVDTSATGVALKVVVIATSGRLVIRNLSGAEYREAVIEMVRKRIVHSL